MALKHPIRILHVASNELTFSIMAGWNFSCLGILLFCLVCSEEQPDTLNVLSILLPYSTAGSANVTIWASDGCYKWFVFKLDILIKFTRACNCLSDLLYSACLVSKY